MPTCVEEPPASGTDEGLVGVAGADQGSASAPRAFAYSSSLSSHQTDGNHKP